MVFVERRDINICFIYLPSSFLSSSMLNGDADCESLPMTNVEVLGPAKNISMSEGIVQRIGRTGRWLTKLVFNCIRFVFEQITRSSFSCGHRRGTQNVYAYCAVDSGDCLGLVNFPKNCFIFLPAADNDCSTQSVVEATENTAIPSLAAMNFFSNMSNASSCGGRAASISSCCNRAAASSCFLACSCCAAKSMCILLSQMDRMTPYGLSLATFLLQPLCKFFVCV